MRALYLFLAVLGAVLPYFFFLRLFAEPGATLDDFVRQLLVTDPAKGFTADLLVSSAVFWIWSFREARVRAMRHWWAYVVVNLTIGLSCALPLFLFFREGSTDPGSDG